MPVKLADVLAIQGTGNRNVSPTTKAAQPRTITVLCLRTGMTPQQFAKRFPDLDRCIREDGYLPIIPPALEGKALLMDLDQLDLHKWSKAEAQREAEEYADGLDGLAAFFHEGCNDDLPW